MKQQVRFKRMRTSIGLTQDQLADYCGVTQSTINKYESGTRTINCLVLNKLEDLFTEHKYQVCSQIQLLSTELVRLNNI